MDASLGMKMGMVSRGDGATAQMRSIYQAGGVATDPSGVARSRQIAPGEHRGQWLLIPKDAPEWASDRQRLWSEAGRAERQWNAQEARVLDIQVPREFPEAAIGDLVHAVYDRFVEGGLAVQVDHHVSPARDGRENPHLHGLISTRPVAPSGFARTKTAARTWNAVFREDGGRAIRRQIAAAINAVAERHGLDLRTDPRTNAERELPAPEPHLPRSVFRAPGTAYARKKLADLDRHRALRADWDRAADEARRDQAVFDGIEQALVAKRAAMPSISPRRQTLSDARLVDKCESAANIARLFGAPVTGFEVVNENTVFVSCAEAEICVQADRAYVDGPVDQEVADFLGELAADLGWERVEVSGGAEPREGAILRNSVRWMGRGLDPREFHIGALSADPDVDDALKACSAAIGGSAQPEKALMHFLDTRRVTTSTQRVLAALLSGSDLGDERYETFELWDLYRARLELGAMAVNQRAWALQARNSSRLEGPQV